MLPERCERSREAVSLHLDGMLSRFEYLLSERHIRRCAACSRFAAAVTHQTELLRRAPLEEHRSAAAALLHGRPQRRRRGAAAIAGAIAATAVAAFLALAPSAGQRSDPTAAAAAAGQGPLLMVFAAQPSPNAKFDVGRLRVVSPASADGPVHGYYGRPVLPPSPI